MGDLSDFSFLQPHISSTPMDEISGERAQASNKLGRTESKANRLLGASSPLYTDFRRTTSRVDDRHGDVDLSFMRISVAEVDSDEDHNDSHQIASPHDPIISPPSNESSRRGSRASSNVLSPDMLDPSVSSSGANTSMPRRVPSTESISTLKTFYDRQRSPLAISQQTSASSARDMALRKGYQTVADGQTDFPRSPRVTDSPNLEDNDAEAGFKKKRPRQLDFSKLFPKPRQSTSGVLSPHRLTHSPSSLSLASDVSQSTTGKERRGFFQRSKNSKKLQKAAPSPAEKPRDVPTPQPRPQEQGQKLTSPKPAFNAKASKILGKPVLNQREWFDSRTALDDSDEEAEAEVDENEQGPRTAPIHRRPSTLSIHSNPPRKFSHDSIGPVPLSAKSVPTNANLHPLYSPPGVPVPQLAERKSIYSISSKCTGTSQKTSASVFSSADLRNQSVLSLSSTEDEFSDDDTSISGAMSEGKKSPKLTPHTVGLAVSSPHRISVGSQSSFGSKQKPTRPKTAPEESELAPSLSSRKRHPHHHHHRHDPPPLPKAPPFDQYQFPSPQAISRNLSRQSTNSEKARPPSVLSSINQSQPSENGAPESLRSPEASVDGDVDSTRVTRRIMTVTEEEEEFLEATRARRLRPTLVSPSAQNTISWAMRDDDTISPLSSPALQPPPQKRGASLRHSARDAAAIAAVASFNFDQDTSSATPETSSSQSASDSSDLVTDQDLDDIASVLARNPSGLRAAPASKRQDPPATITTAAIPTAAPGRRPTSTLFPRGPPPTGPLPAIRPQPTSATFAMRTHPRYELPGKHAPINNSYRIPDRRSSIRGPVY
ncbi:MAG: hypothetical protein M4579_002774 [Chaenotheca gracillima]|nr:MAG: hypothetical protein M4579_002774 [Chaenotheca gracillima]